MNMEETIKEVKRDIRECKLDLKQILLEDVKNIMIDQSIGETEAFKQWIETEAKRRIEIREFVQEGIKRFDAEMSEWLRGRIANPITA